MAMPALADGQKFAVRVRIEAVLHVEFFTSEAAESRCTLPVGFPFVIWGIPDPGAERVPVRPVEDDRWEPILVRASDRNDPLYRGFRLEISRDDLALRCDRVWA